MQDLRDMTLWYTLGVEAYVTTNPGLKSCTVLALFIFKDEFIPSWGAIGVPNFESQDETSRYYTPITGTLFRAFSCHTATFFRMPHPIWKIPKFLEIPNRMRILPNSFQAFPGHGTQGQGPNPCHAVSEGEPEASEEQDWWLVVEIHPRRPKHCREGSPNMSPLKCSRLSLLCCPIFTT